MQPVYGSCLGLIFIQYFQIFPLLSSIQVLVPSKLFLTHSVVALFAAKTYYFPHVVSCRDCSQPSNVYIDTDATTRYRETDRHPRRRRRSATVLEFEIFNKAVGDFIFDGRNKVTLTLESCIGCISDGLVTVKRILTFKSNQLWVLYNRNGYLHLRI